MEGTENKEPPLGVVNNVKMVGLDGLDAKKDNMPCVALNMRHNNHT